MVPYLFVYCRNCGYLQETMAKFPSASSTGTLCVALVAELFLWTLVLCWKPVSYTCCGKSIRKLCVLGLHVSLLLPSGEGLILCDTSKPQNMCTHTCAHRPLPLAHILKDSSWGPLMFIWQQLKLRWSAFRSMIWFSIIDDLFIKCFVEL